VDDGCEEVAVREDRVDLVIEMLAR